MSIINNNGIFIKVGRIYWIKPIPIHGFPSKERPAIALQIYDGGKTTFLQIGSTDSKIPSSNLATKIFRDGCRSSNTSLLNSFIHIDASKPEWNTAIIKPHIEFSKYIELDHKDVRLLREIYFNRMIELEAIRMRKAKIAVINGDDEEALKQLKMLKNSHPKKHQNLEPKLFLKKLKFTLS